MAEKIKLYIRWCDTQQEGCQYLMRSGQCAVNGRVKTMPFGLCPCCSTRTVQVKERDLR